MLAWESGVTCFHGHLVCLLGKSTESWNMKLYILFLSMSQKRSSRIITRVPIWNGILVKTIIVKLKRVQKCVIDLFDQAFVSLKRKGLMSSKISHHNVNVSMPAVQSVFISSEFFFLGSNLKIAMNACHVWESKLNPSKLGARVNLLLTVKKYIFLN